ncbi:uncharacterized protein LOC111034567 [Myzus persicae]|uniref:uncharacterized protein LOC111034567 n=1 Tax=Myzus persicae TaxID=13164 RepID=UPI000B93735B|nr:uncharacterized protein LOC111034567 [Myzus persicae]
MHVIVEANDVVEELRPTTPATSTKSPKAMKWFPKQPGKYHPVLLMNQLIPTIEYGLVMVEKNPKVFRVYFELAGVMFQGYGNICNIISLLLSFYTKNGSDWKLLVSLILKNTILIQNS